MKKLILLIVLISMSSCYVSDWLLDPSYREYPNGRASIEMMPFDGVGMPGIVMMEDYLYSTRNPQYDKWVAISILEKELNKEVDWDRRQDISFAIKILKKSN